MKGQEISGFRRKDDQDPMEQRTIVWSTVVVTAQPRGFELAVELEGEQSARETDNAGRVTGRRPRVPRRSRLPAAAAGTVSFGHFWTDRPYNVYHWMDGTTGATIGYYVNLADSTRVDGDLLEWRDLAVDILIRPDGNVTVLDEDESLRRLAAQHVVDFQGQPAGDQSFVFAQFHLVQDLLARERTSAPVLSAFRTA
jgi:hypothetical protein